MKQGSVWMPLYIGDYLADTMHLDGAAHGAYLLMLMHCWRMGPLPDDDRQLAIIARTAPDTWRDEVGPVVRRFFTATDAGLIQKRLEEERVAATENADRKTTAGRKGAEARWQRHSDRIATAERDQCPSPSPSPIEGTTSPSSDGEVEAAGPPAAPLARQKPEIGDALLWDLCGAWNEVVANAGLPQVKDLTLKRKTALRARIKERWQQDPVRQFRAYARRIATSPFLTGGNDRGWRADFDWALKPDNVLKVAEGKFHPEQEVA
jgi:uncharacterized protein YdaU (DUF1376 family)